MRMPSKPPVLIAGQVTLSHFEKLKSFGTDIRSEKTINALREHLVNGTQKTKACKQHLASPSQFSANLKVMQEAAQAALDLFAEDFYRTRLAGQENAQAATI
ncbi:PapB/FocB family fimbrial expression transcriptional regulator [Pseudomonas sp. PLMAX]|uniref:PapB/FocB family fimbrial expression transcriptional regulator n=1 Tax=Pseudomonas sp. PLMAX TaxID=2201998 RepID=UPI0038BCC2DC